MTIIKRDGFCASQIQNNKAVKSKYNGGWETKSRKFIKNLTVYSFIYQFDLHNENEIYDRSAPRKMTPLSTSENDSVSILPYFK